MILNVQLTTFCCEIVQKCNTGELSMVYVPSAKYGVWSTGRQVRKTATRFGQLAKSKGFPFFDGTYAVRILDKISQASLCIK